MDASGWPVVATHLATHFTRWETNDGNGWRRLDIQKRRWNLARRDRHRARQGHRAQEAAHGPRQDQGGGEHEAQDEAGRIRARKGFTPNSPSPRLMDWLETWYHERAEANLRPNSRRSYENAIVRLNKIAGARRISSLGHKDMAAIQDGLKCYSPKTATITWSVLKNALEAARDENLIRTNPAKMVRPVSGRRRPMKVLSPAQAAELIRNEPDPMWRLNWLLAFATGH